MPNIRHLKFNDLNLPDPPTGHDDDIVLENLQTLARLYNFKFSKEVVKRIPNIKKLSITYDKRYNLDDDRDFLNNLDCLVKLESLKCCLGNGINMSGVAINFPHSLKKLLLNIAMSQYWQDVLDKIGVLPLLQKLTLVGGSFKEGTWETTEGQFPSLKYLYMRSCEDLQVWTTESSHFSCLKCLRLSNIYRLEEIPLDFAEMSTLEQIYLDRCSYSVAVSAKTILEEREELYGEEGDLQVEVVNFNWAEMESLESLESRSFRVRSTN